MKEENSKERGGQYMKGSSGTETIMAKAGKCGYEEMEGVDKRWN